jgi:hypothetical protein
MSKSRLPLYLGLGVAGAGGYYLYNSGGDANAAAKRAKGILSFYQTFFLF